ncbi:MAG: [FeFe] hydrogenase H-cluster radical SAM maturase HydG [Candidatus Omnitrophota bacterium]
MIQKIIDERNIHAVLEKTKSSPSAKIKEIFEKAQEKKGLGLIEAGILANSNDEAVCTELFRIAGSIKKDIYGERLVFFAPLYISDFCVNDCSYCNFHSSNTGLSRRKLSLEEVEAQTRLIIAMGHKRVLLECGEDPRHNPIDDTVRAIQRIYGVKTDKGNIRRINVNVAATSKDDYAKLKAAGIGTYQLFQETYHRQTYASLHCGPKADYRRQLTAPCRAYEAGIDDYGMGVLFGLYDWRFEVLSLIAHAQCMEKEYGVGPHTFSVPRFRPAPTVTFKPGYPVSDNDFLKLIAILRICVPYTGMILSTRESPEIRKKAFKIGISQASAGSCTVTGGYGSKSSQPQFEITDERNLEEVIKDIIAEGFLPSFCTACYRSGRTGERFMGLSKTGHIHTFCRPNALLTFAEYLEDFAKANGVYVKGHELIAAYLAQIEDEEVRAETKKRLALVAEGRRDLYF